MIFLALSLFLVVAPFQIVKADIGDWTVYWQQYNNYVDAPLNISTTTIVQGANGHVTTRVVLAVSIYRYYHEVPEIDSVNFRVAVYVDSFADPGYQPQFAYGTPSVTIRFEKKHRFYTWTQMETDPNFPQSQGNNLTQSQPQSSGPDGRIELALKTLEFAVGCVNVPAGVAVSLINAGYAFASQQGPDYRNANLGDWYGYSWWNNQAYLGSDSPVRQYCFNTFKWRVGHEDPPWDEYELDIFALVSTLNHAVIPTVETGPCRLIIRKYSGAGCPILSVYNGSNYVCEGLLNIHNPEGVDVVYQHTLVSTPQSVNGAYLMRLTEHNQTHSYIDQVKLYAILEDGTMKRLPLIYAWHSEDGNVLPQLRHSDDWKTDTLGADLNNGTSQSIDLKFASLSPNLEVTGFMFQIEGNNRIAKT